MWSFRAHLAIACIGGSLLMDLAGALYAQPPEGEIRVARLVKQLASPDFEERDEADAQLARLGVASRDELEKATKSDDPEVRLRAHRLLARLKAAQLWLAGESCGPQKQRLASEVLAELGKSSGNHVLVGEQYGTFVNGLVDLDDKPRSYWETVDLVCRQSGNHTRPHYDTRTPGLVITSGALGKNPVAYSGPVRAQVTSARRVFIEELDFEQLKPDLTHTFQINLHITWEDRFRLLGYFTQPELIEAHTDTGAVVTAAQTSAGSWNVISPGTKQLTTSVRLNPPPIVAASLATLKFKWPLLAVGDMAKLEVDDLTSDRRHEQDDVVLRVTHCTRHATGRYDLNLVICRDLAAPEPQDVLFQENEIELFDQQGRAFRLQSQSNSLTEQGLELRLSFSGDSADSQAKSLRLSYPRIRVRKNLEITFRNVPLPLSKPE